MYEQTQHHRSRYHSYHDFMAEASSCVAGAFGPAKRTLRQHPVHADITDFELGEHGVIAYPGRVVRLPHPKGATVEGITSGQVAWSANPIPSCNPMIQDAL